MKKDFTAKLKIAIRDVLNEEVQLPNDLTWRNLLAVWLILPIVVSLTLMIYTETTITCKPYLLFVPSAVVTMFYILTRNSVWFNKTIDNINPFSKAICEEEELQNK